MGGRVIARYLGITVNAIDRTTELVSHSFIFGDKQTFKDFTGMVPTAWKFEAVQDHAVGTLWDLAATSTTEIPFLYKPYGNSTASVASPHYSGTVVPAGPDDTFAGGSAGDSTTEGLTFSSTWRVTSWTKVTA